MAPKKRVFTAWMTQMGVGWWVGGLKDAWNTLKSEIWVLYSFIVIWNLIVICWETDKRITYLFLPCPLDFGACAPPGPCMSEVNCQAWYFLEDLHELIRRFLPSGCPTLVPNQPWFPIAVYINWSKYFFLHNGIQAPQAYNTRWWFHFIIFRSNDFALPLVASLDLAWKRSCHEGGREESHWDHPFSAGAELSSLGPKYSFVSSLCTMKLTKIRWNGPTQSWNCGGTWP